MFSGKEWGTALRFWSENLLTAYRNFTKGESPDRQTRLARIAGSTIGGASMCMLVSLLERLVLDLLTANNPQGQATQVRLQDPAWRGQLNLDVNWDGWRLLDGVVALRHCFAHEFGRVTARQRNAIVSLQADLGAGGVSVTLLNQLPGGAAKQVTIAPFFKVDSSDNILLDQDSTSKALRLLCLGVLRQLEHQGHIVL